MASTTGSFFRDLQNEPLRDYYKTWVQHLAPDLNPGTCQGGCYLESNSTMHLHVVCHLVFL